MMLGTHTNTLIGEEKEKKKRKRINKQSVTLSRQVM